jgi:hypothetical protein
MFYEFNKYPDDDKKSGYGYELEKEPNLFQLHLLNHAPGVVKRDEGFPPCYACLLKHAVQPHKGSDQCNKK